MCLAVLDGSDLVAAGLDASYPVVAGQVFRGTSIRGEQQWGIDHWCLTVREHAELVMMMAWTLETHNRHVEGHRGHLGEFGPGKAQMVAGHPDGQNQGNS